MKNLISLLSNNTKHEFMSLLEKKTNSIQEFWSKWKKIMISGLCAAHQPNAPRPLFYAPCHFAEGFWRPSRCQNCVCDSSLEILLSLISKKSGIFQFGVHFPCQKSNLPRLVKMCKMRLPQGRVLLQSTFEGLPQLQIELRIAHWKYICV